MRAAILATCALALAGCQTTGPTPPAAAVPAAPIDAKIAKVSADLAKNCALLQGGLAVAEAFNKSVKVKPIIAAARATAADFCAAPPTDTATAIQLVAQAAIEVSNAMKEAQP